MRFSGHETFSIREGWLHKGLKLLLHEPHLLTDEYSADWLGVGQNMAKSIRYWLTTTGLADSAPDRRASDGPALRPTDLAHLIWDNDPYFSETGTWWALHVNLVNNTEQATSWAWFFNSFAASRFEKAVCVDGLRRYLQLSTSRALSGRTIERDLACLLRSYARPIPLEQEDPEEALDCPFVELGLLSYYRASGYYQFIQSIKDIPPHLFGFCLSTAFEQVRTGAGNADVSLSSAIREAGGPGRCFVLGGESLFDLVLRLEEATRGKDIQVAGLAGERVIRVPRRSPLDWMSRYYRTVAQRSRHVA